MPLHGPAMLFCPADRPDRYAKALAAADTAILDLEDAVAPEAKDAARTNLVKALPELPADRVVVRLNGADTPWFAEDLAAMRQAGVRTVMVPKVAGPAGLAGLEGLDVIALCETAAGVVHAAEIAGASCCLALMWGGEDLTADLGGVSSRDPDGAYYPVVAHAASAVLLAARAAGKLAVDAVHIDIRDIEGLQAESRAAAAQGFAAKACIHPSHAQHIRDAYAPSPQRLEWARGVLQAQQEAGGTGVFSYDGGMVDGPLLAQARGVVQAAGGH